MNKDNVNPTAPKKQDSYLRNFLELFAVFGFAIAQPLYSLMSKNPEFFTAHQFHKWDFISLVLVLGLLIPFMLILVESVLGLFSKKARGCFHVFGLSIGIFLIVLPIFCKLFQNSTTWPILLSLLITCIAISLYLFFHVVRSYLSLLAFAGLVFPLFFLFFTPINRLFFYKAEYQQVEFQKENIPNIVFIVFDEFNTTPLLNHKYSIDSVRFPNFAALMNDGVWFPRASSVSSATILAVPAALTGLKPDGEKHVPSIVDFPKNIFTILADKYDMNVMEPYTSLFPSTLSNDIDKESSFNKLVSSISDLIIIYKYIVYPHPMRSKLPSITHTFKGFTDDKVDPDAAKSKNNKAYNRDERRQDVLTFIEHINKTKRPSLNFLHVLLPHHFHDYLPSGQFYSPAQLMDGQILPANAWEDNQLLADLSYQRFILQVGFVDRMVGEIVAKMKSEGIYDDSIIVLTADHGVCFRANQPIRPLSKDNYSDILSVPLFLKLPHQESPKIDLRFAETTDIVPTILDYIGAKISWELDGHSLISGELPQRTMKHTFDLDTKSWYDYSYDSITAYPYLDYAINKFGSDTPLDDLHELTKYEHLYGNPSQNYDLQIDDGFFPEIFQWALFENDLDLDGDFLPLYISGNITAPSSFQPPYHLAICINGTIRSIAQTYQTEAGVNTFRTILPKSSIVKGMNNIAIALIKELPDSHIQLITNQSGNPYTLCDLNTDHPYIQKSNGEIIPIVPNDILGALEPFKPSTSFVSAVGWAVNRRNNAPAKKVVLFADDKYVATIDVTIERKDIGNWLGSEYLISGYKFELPVSVLLNHEISAYGITIDGKASELTFYRAPSKTPDSPFERFTYKGAAE